MRTMETEKKNTAKKIRTVQTENKNTGNRK